MKSALIILCSLSEWNSLGILSLTLSIWSKRFSLLPNDMSISGRSYCWRIFYLSLAHRTFEVAAVTNYFLSKFVVEPYHIFVCVTIPLFWRLLHFGSKRCYFIEIQVYLIFPLDVFGFLFQLKWRLVNWKWPKVMLAETSTLRNPPGWFLAASYLRAVRTYE